ncbi:MAG: S41 family peptidase [Solirubrobacteraceae bacterium]
MPARPGRSSRLAAGIASALAILVVGVWLGGHPGWIPSGIRGTFSNEGRTGQFVQGVLDTVQANFYRKVSVTKLANAGLGAAVASLGDPYTHYYSPSEYRAFQSESNPRVRGGIGVDVQANRRGVLITSVFPSSPAARAGLQAGEVIVGVGSKSLAGHSPFYASSLITGKPGTPVTLVLLDNGRRRMLRLVRETVTFVAGSGLLHYHGVPIGKLVFNHFSDRSGALLRVQVDKVLSEGARALILDLRGNGGGLLQEAVNVASIFIPDGTIVSTDGRTQPRQVYVARGGAISTSIPLVVLVDGNTASSSEIVTAALQDRGRAKVVGTHTYGKGVYQEIQTLPNGGALELTVGEFFTPNGRNLGGGGDKRGAGVTPNVYVAPGANANVDRQLQVAERVVASEVR